MLHPNHQDPKTILVHFQAALERFYQERPAFDENSGERALAFRLGIYLNQLFPELNVDAEYNRNETDYKMLRNLYEVMLSETDLDYLNKLFPNISNRYKVRDSNQPENGDLFYPDLIIHRRGSNLSNTLVIEVKRFNNLSLPDIHQDFKKLRELTKLAYDDVPYRYALGMFVYLHPKEISLTRWLAFTNGEINQDLSRW